MKRVIVVLAALVLLGGAFWGVSAYLHGRDTSEVGAPVAGQTLLVRLAWDRADLVLAGTKKAPWLLPPDLMPVSLSPDGRCLVALGPGSPPVPPFARAPWLYVPDKGWRDLSPVAGAADRRGVVWLDDRSILFHWEGQTSLYDVVEERAERWAPLGEGRRVGIAFSSSTRRLASLEYLIPPDSLPGSAAPAGSAASEELGGFATDLVLRSPAGEELGRFPRVGHSGLGELVHYRTNAMDWFPDGSGVVFSDDDAVQSTQRVIHLKMGSGETQVLLEKPFGVNSNPYDVDAFYARAGGSTAVKPMVVSRSAEGVFVYGPAFGLPSSPVGPLTPGGSRASGLPSPDGRLLAVTADGKTAIYRAWDLPAAPLLVLDTGEAFAWSADWGELGLYLLVTESQGD